MSRASRGCPLSSLSRVGAVINALSNAVSENQSAPPPEDRRDTNRILLVAFVTMFLDLVGFGIIIPIQPFYAMRYDASATMVTLLGASYSLMQFVFVPLWGRLSDRIGRRPVILSSVAIGGIGYLLFGLAGSLPMLFAARMLSGFGNANIATVQAIVADVTTAENRTRGMGMIGAAFGLGFIIGPALGGLLGQFGLAVPAYGAAFLALINLALATWLLPETFPPERREARSERRGRLEELRLTLTIPNILLITLMFLTLTFGFGMVEQALALFIEVVFIEERDDAGLRRAAALTSYLLVSIGIVSTVIQGGLIGRLSRRFGEVRLLHFGIPILIVGVFSFTLAGNAEHFFWMLPSAVLVATGLGLTNPSLNSLLSQTASAQVQGGTLGVGQSASALGRVIGPAASGALFSVATGLPFYVGMASLTLTYLLSLALRQPQPTDGQPPAR